MKLSPTYNLAALHPKLAKEWHLTRNGDLTLYQVTPGSSRKVWWRCSQEHEWEAAINSRTSGNGCPECYKEDRCGIYRKARAHYEI
ncbi:MAG: zinc-ribbon domain-containing protein [Candidatus Bathyarchaeota archaeon]|nr:zinc-ribbon domain-containing protein [Candidatus Bathyarchaeota archaeon]